MRWTLAVIMSGGSRLLRRCVFYVKDFHWEKKKKTERGREKNVRGCWLVYRLCIDFSLSDTLIFHMEQSALSLPAFCLCLNSVPHQHDQRLLKTKCLPCQLFYNRKPSFFCQRTLWATFQQFQNKQMSHRTTMHFRWKVTVETDPMDIYRISR